MNAMERLILATAAIIYGMTAQLPANEAVKETQEAINKWYEETSTSISKDMTSLGTTIEKLPENISLGVSNFIEESKQYQKEQWRRSSEQNQQNLDYIKSLFGPKEQVKKQ